MEILKEPTSLPFFWELYELKYVRCLEQCLNKERAPTEVFSVSKIKISWKNFLVISYLQHVCIRRHNFFSAVRSYHHNTTKKGKFVQICINKRKKKKQWSAFLLPTPSPKKEKTTWWLLEPTKQSRWGCSWQEAKGRRQFTEAWLSGWPGRSEGPPDLEKDKVWEVRCVMGKEPCFMEASSGIGRTSDGGANAGRKGCITPACRADVQVQVWRIRRRHPYRCLITATR